MSALPVTDDPGPCALIYDEHGRPTWKYRIEPFQYAVAASGLSLGEIAVRMGWHPRDASRVSRMLGLKSWASGKVSPATGKHYPAYRAKSLSYENAKRLARVLELDLVEWEI